MNHPNTRDAGRRTGGASASERRFPALRNNPGWLITLGLTVGIALLASSTPFLPARAGGLVMKLFSGVCHQLPGRSPHLDGVQLAVCHRCFGIYWALPVAAVVYRLTRTAGLLIGNRGLLVLLLAAIPAGVDWLGDLFGLWANAPVSRMATGAVLGLGAGYLMAKAMSDLFTELRQAREGRKSTLA